MQIEWMEKVCVQVGKMNKIIVGLLFEIMQISLQFLIMVFLCRKYRTLVARKFEFHYLLWVIAKDDFRSGGGGGGWSLARFVSHRLYENEGVCPNVT